MYKRKSCVCSKCRVGTQTNVIPVIITALVALLLALFVGAIYLM